MVRALAACVSAIALAHGQAIAQPATVTVTPPTLVPPTNAGGVRVEIPEDGALQAPPGSEDLAVTLAGVRVENAFPEVAGQIDKVTAALIGRRVTLREIYAAASEIEAIHARAGFVLARISVPPQDLADHSTLHIVVTDGFIESVDTKNVPSGIRDVLTARTARLVGRRHVTLAEIEESLLIAGDTPGLSLRSTLARGNVPGGVLLVLSGTHQIVTGSLGADNSLDPSLGTWAVNAQLALNSAFGLGEQIYGFVSSGYDVSKLPNERDPVRVVGGGMLLPIGDGRLTINPEVTFSHTRPLPLSGLVQTDGELRRLSLRANLALRRTRGDQGGASLVIEQIAESNKAPDFHYIISRDRYIAARLGLAWTWLRPDRSAFGLSGQLTQGLGNFGALTEQDALASGVPFSRVGAGPSFTKLTGGTQASFTVGQDLDFRLQARGQTSFGKPLLRAEQFATEGPDGVSAYVGGVTAVDEGVVGRVEIGTRLAPARTVGAAPYLFAAAGTGTLARPTAVEPGRISAEAVGAGLRLDFGRWFQLSVEYAHGFSNITALDNADRGNVTTSIHF